MGFWIKHPRTDSADTMLTAAIAGFVFAVMFATAAFVAAWVTNTPSYLNNVALIVGAIITPTVGAYTARKYTDTKNGNGKVTSESGE